MPTMAKWSRSDAFKVLYLHPLAASLGWDVIAEQFHFDRSVIDDPEGNIPAATLFAVFEYAAKELGNDAIMFDIFNTSDVGSFTVFDYLFVCAPTLRDACLAWQRYMPIRTNAYEFRFYEDDELGTLEVLMPADQGVWQQNMFARFGWAIRRFETVLEDQTPPLVVELTAPEPTGQSKFLDRYRGKIFFNRRRNAISVPAELLSKRLPKNETSLYTIIQKSALKEMAIFQNLNSPITRIANEITETLKTGTCSLAQVANNLKMSQRSIQRTLEQQGTSFRQVTEDVRKSAAERYLKTTDLQLKEIAFLLGFSELSTFSRAVKSWFGEPPRKVRENQRM